MIQAGAKFELIKSQILNLYSAVFEGRIYEEDYDDYQNKSIKSFFSSPIDEDIDEDTSDTSEDKNDHIETDEEELSYYLSILTDMNVRVNELHRSIFMYKAVLALALIIILSIIVLCISGTVIVYLE